MSASIIQFPRTPSPAGEIVVYPDDFDGGCWSVQHLSRSGDSSALLGRFFSFGEAERAARAWAAELGADLDEGTPG